MLNEASIVEFLERDTSAGPLEVNAHAYPFASTAVDLWRQWAVHDGHVMHGMDPDFVLPLLATDPIAPRAILITGTRHGHCDLAAVVVPEASLLWSGKCWQLYTHNHIDVNGFLSDQSPHTYDSIFDLVSEGLATKNIELARLSLTKMQFLGSGSRSVLDKGILFNAYFNLAGPSAYSVPAKLRRNIKRISKKLDTDVGPLSMQVAPARLENTTLFFDIEASGWKKEQQTAIKFDRNLRRAYLTATRDRRSLSRAHVFTLYAGNIAISSAYGLIYPEFVSLLKIGFDERFSNYSPGTLLLSRILEHVRNSGKTKLCLSTDPPWIARWKPRHFIKQNLRVHADNYAGRRLYKLGYTLRSIKRIVRNLKQKAANQ